MNRKFVVRLLSFVVVFSLWEYFGRRVNPILFTYPTAIARALFRWWRAVNCRVT